MVGRASRVLTRFTPCTDFGFADFGFSALKGGTMPKIACSTTVFSRRPLAEALDQIRALEFRHVDLLMMGGWAHLDPAAVALDPLRHARDVAALLEARRLHATALNTRLTHDTATADSVKLAANERELEALCQLAAECGVPVITLSPGRGDAGVDAETAIARLVANLKRFVEVARQRGVLLTIENHSNTLVERPELTLRVLDAVPGLRLTYDPSHLVMTGQSLDLVPRLVDRAFHVHLRDAVPGSYQAPLGEGRLDFARELATLRAWYKGETVAIEYLDNHSESDVVPDVRELKALLEAELA